MSKQIDITTSFTIVNSGAYAGQTRWDRWDWDSNYYQLMDGLAKQADLTLPNANGDRWKNEITAEFNPNNTESTLKHAWNYKQIVNTKKLMNIIQGFDGRFLFNPKVKSWVKGRYDKYTSIAPFAFGNWEFPSTLSDIDYQSFYQQLLTSITFNSTVDLGKESFKSNPYLTEVKIIGDNRITLGKECFNDCYSLKDIDLSKTDVNWKSESQSCFANTAIKHVVIPTHWELIPDNAFENCPNLKTVDLSKFKGTIGDSAFQGCKNLTKVILGEGPYTFDRHCFADCKKLEDIDMSNAEVVIHGRAFNNDEELSEIKLSSSKSINLGSEALYNLASLEWPNDTWVIGDNYKELHSHLLETKDEIVRDTYKQYKQPIPRIKKLVLDNDHVLMQNQFEQCQPKHWIIKKLHPLSIGFLDSENHTSPWTDKERIDCVEIQNPHIIITPVQCFTFVERGYYSDGMTSEKANKRKGYLQNAIHTLIVPKETLPFYQSYWKGYAENIIAATPDIEKSKEK